MKKWYDMSEKERIKNIYSKYTISSFWNWWNKDSNSVMEVRIKNWNLVKEVATKYKLPYSPSGVYVKNYIELKNVIAYVRNKTTVWFGINQRKRNWNKKGWKVFSGGDHFVESINFIFIDIDRVKKEGPASNEQLRNCDIMANKILEQLDKEKWSEDYIKICSGNGLQLLIRLDIPIRMPLCEFDNATKLYINDNEFEKTKNIIVNGIGKNIIKFAKKFKTELQVEVDKSCMFIGKVGALPVTKNYKFNSFTWRGIVDIKKETNTDLTDYVWSKESDIKQFNAKNVFGHKSPYMKDMLQKGKLKNHKLIKFMLDNNLPAGYINNTLWMQIKCLLRDSKIDLRSKEFVDIHNKLKIKHRRTFTLNLPDKKYSFNEGTVNNYCINNGFSLLYKLWPNKTKKLVMCLDAFSWNTKDLIDETMELGDEDIFTDLRYCKGKLKENDLNNIDIIGAFMNGLIKKYGEERTKYFYDNDIIRRGLEYD